MLKSLEIPINYVVFLGNWNLKAKTAQQGEKHKSIAPPSGYFYFYIK